MADAMKLILAFDVQEYVDGYEFRGDEGTHTPTENERALLTDAILGVLSEISLAASPQAPAEGAGEFDDIEQHLKKLEASEVYAYEKRIADLEHQLALRDRTSDPARESWASMAKWTEETFGPVSLERIATRANEEMQELLADPSDVMEAADVCIVLSRYPGIEDAINRKMAINRKREWRLNGDGSGYHVKTGEANTHPALRARTSEPAREAVAWADETALHALSHGRKAVVEPVRNSFGFDKPLYTHPAPATADKLKVAVDLLDGCIWLNPDTGNYEVEHDGSVEKARSILATLNEGGEA